ncbi:MAG: hypothetical protein HQK58_08945 [Deltaproteobacteria bacterium]|nr:hypothetical protein [Deltaproteobacteria bacterium]
MKTCKILIVFLAFAMLGGCASIKVYRPPFEGKDQEEGIKVYSPKPYMLVARAGEDGKVISVNPVMLPDLSDPQFIRETVGIGHANLTLSVEGGILKSFGGDVDTKVPETIKEIGALATGYGTLVKTLSEAGKIDEEAAKLRKESIDTAKINAAIKIINSASNSIKAIVDDALTQNYRLTETQTGVLNKISENIKEIGKSIKSLFDNPDIDVNQFMLDEYAKSLREEAKKYGEEKDSLPPEATDKHPVRKILNDIGTAATMIASKPAAAPVFELYEVDNSKKGKGTTLKKIEIPVK